MNVYLFILLSTIHEVFIYTQAYQSTLVGYRQSVDSGEGVQQPDWLVTADEDLTHLSLTPTFTDEDYENGIRVVTGED